MTAWPGKEYGIRAPDRDETPLSAEEVLVLIVEMMKNNSYFARLVFGLV